MKQFFMLACVLLFAHNLVAQKLTVVDFDAFEPQLHKKTDTLYMIHFWATWCIPCLKEMPIIMEETKAFSNEKFKLVLVSFDFTKDIETKLKPYLKNQDIKQRVFVMDDPDYNSWINKVDTRWSGALPATYFYQMNDKEFYEGSFRENELTLIINTKLNKHKQ